MKVTEWSPQLDQLWQVLSSEPYLKMDEKNIGSLRWNVEPKISVILVILWQHYKRDYLRNETSYTDKRKKLTASIPTYPRNVVKFGSQNGW